MKQIKPLTSDPDNTVIVEMLPREYLAFLDFMGQPKRPAVQTGKGLKGIMELFHCSKSKAYEIAHAEWFQPAVIPVLGRTILFDEVVALELAHNQGNLNIKPAAKRA